MLHLWHGAKVVVVIPGERGWRGVVRSPAGHPESDLAGGEYDVWPANEHWVARTDERTTRVHRRHLLDITDPTEPGISP